MRLLFLNQYGPPDTPPTARLLGELADFLRTRGHEVEILAQRAGYRGRPTGGRGRLRRELAALLSILRMGWPRRTPRPEVVLALSSPPGLLVVGALLAWRHRARLAHWAMDLYPELALALGEIRPGWPARLVRAAMSRAYRRAHLVVALDEDMRVHLQPLCRPTVRVLEPWPSPAAERQFAGLNPRTLADVESSAPWTWLYSGNLGRAHEWQTLLDAQRLLEERARPVRLVFQGDGAARAPATAHAEGLGLRACEWRNYVPEEDLVAHLLRARVLIVTQRPETCGLLWPSKLALLERLPRPILFVGPVDGAIARRLRERGEAGVFAPGQAQAVADWVEALFLLPTPAAAPERPTRDLPMQAGGCAALEEWLAACVK